MSQVAATLPQQAAPAKSLVRRRTRSSTARVMAQRFKLGVIGGALLAVIVALALSAPVLPLMSPEAQRISQSLQPPGAAGYLLGTDDLGRDMLSRLIWGARVSLAVGFLSTASAMVVGVAVGLAAGYLGRWVDTVSMRVVDVVLAFPTLVLAVAIVGVLGPGIVNGSIAIALVSVPRFTRVVRAETMRLKQLEFVLAAVAMGGPGVRILLRHILPQTTGLVVVQGSLSVAAAILAEASLSFLGLGVQPPTPAWGGMLRTGYPFLDRAPWIAIEAGLAITLTVLGCSLLGDAIRDYVDPRLREQ
jgi:peptide/nickel transport system permease protein